MRINSLPELKGYIKITKSELVSHLGLPYFYSKNGRKQCLWKIDFITGEEVSIYDYDSRTKLWKIGSDYDSAVERIKITFPMSKVSERLTKKRQSKIKLIVATPYGKLKLKPDEEMCDIGNNIGYALGRFLPISESECEEFIHGIRHGISLTNGIH